MLFNTFRTLVSITPKRHFFGALNAVFNSVSPSRIKLVGPDRACAEWLMRNGAHIRWVGQEDYVEHYDNLPLDPEDTTAYHIEEIFAKDASLTHHGFPHLRGCAHIKRIALIHCIFINNLCVDSLAYVRGSLQALEMRSCPELTADGLLKLGYIFKDSNLQCLKFGDLSKMQPEELLDVVQILQQKLPFCNVQMLSIRSIHLGDLMTPAQLHEVVEHLKKELPRCDVQIV